jgi:predicted amidohydrolase
MDLAAMLALSERAAEEGVQVLVFPQIPGLGGEHALLDAFFSNVTERAPGLTTVRPRWRHRGDAPPAPITSGLGRTLILGGDDCVDPAIFPRIQELGVEALVWLFAPEDALQAEAVLELALDASLRLAPLVVIATYTGRARGLDAHGIGAIVQLGEILVEGDSGEELLVADVPAPGGFTERPRNVPVPAPVLQQRLAVHRSDPTNRHRLS